MYAKAAIGLRTVEKWIAAFDGRRTKPVDLPEFGRSHDTGTAGAVRALIEWEGQLSQNKSPRLLGIRHETVKCILRDGLKI
jgi:hypothetical protein